MPERRLKQSGFSLGYLLKAKKEYKNLKKQEIQDIIIKTNYNHSQNI